MKFIFLIGITITYQMDMAFQVMTSTGLNPVEFAFMKAIRLPLAQESD
jgi:hypothetical protein